MTSTKSRFSAIQRYALIIMDPNYVKIKKSLAPLPKWEISLCFAIWIGHSLYSWYVVWRASTSLESRLYSGFFEPGWGILNNRKRDISNFEWVSFMLWLPLELFAFVIHLIAVRILDRFGMDQWKRDAALTFVWIGLLWMKLGMVGVLTTAIHGGLMLTVARLCPWKPAVWICACSLLGTLASEKYPLPNDADIQYRFAVYVAYKLLHFLSFCLCDIDATRAKVKSDDDQEIERRRPPIQAYYSMMRYTLYPPYAATLIVIYPDYQHQWDQRRTTTLDIPNLVCMIIRVAFWTIFNDLLLHFVYNNAMMMDQYLLAEVDVVTLCAVGYTAGQYFHMKYVSIFGLNTIFALLDGMTPPKWPPICISRVSLYSNMWRSFDRGLYSFMRTHVFIPIASPRFTFFRRTVASLVCFSFIWLWHGLSWGFLYWVSMNFIEVSLENICKQISRFEVVHEFVIRKFSNLNLRRIRACFHVVCTAWGIFSIFYFLGGDAVGHVFVKRLVVDEFKIQLPLLYLIGLGYFFAQVCMEIEHYVQ